MKSQWMSQFVSQFGTDEGDETTSFNGTIPQVLMMFNGGLVKQATDTKNGTLLSKVAGERAKFPQKVEYLFRAAFARKPSSNETKMFMEIAKGGAYKNEQTMLTDIWWAMLNSNEFIFNH